MRILVNVAIRGTGRQNTCRFVNVGLSFFEIIVHGMLYCIRISKYVTVRDKNIFKFKRKTFFFWYRETELSMGRLVQARTRPEPENASPNLARTRK